ncbi:hypothetical protein QE390_002547 [Siphonobacter sp. SORGH_AS 1065]|nr:hypothetical protein [Siphonobacter sp. SORGH_AS_1065]
MIETKVRGTISHTKSSGVNDMLMDIFGRTLSFGMLDSFPLFLLLQTSYLGLKIPFAKGKSF